MTLAHDSAGWALADIDDILKEGLIDEELARRGREVVGLLFNRDTVYASVSPIDDGDLCFHWVAGKRMISIILIAKENEEPNYRGVWYAVSDGEGGKVIHSSPGLPMFLYEALDDFSKAVDAVNPDWPKLSKRYGT